MHGSDFRMSAAPRGKNNCSCSIRALFNTKQLHAIVWGAGAQRGRSVPGALHSPRDWSTPPQASQPRSPVAGRNQRR